MSYLRCCSFLVLVGGTLGLENLNEESASLTNFDKFVPEASVYQEQDSIFQIVDDNYISTQR